MDLIVVSGPNQLICTNAEGGRLITESYCLLPTDLRQTAALEAALKLAKLQLDVPTYIIAECVLVYMRPDESNAVVRWLAEHLQQAAFVLYEQVCYDSLPSSSVLNVRADVFAFVDCC